MNIKKDLKKIIILLIIFCIVILIVLSNIVDKKEHEHITIDKSDPIRTDRYLKLNGFGVFFEQYDGKLTTGEISKKLEEITTKYLPEMYTEVKVLDESELEEYFDDHTFRLESCFGIEEPDEFNDFVSKLKAIGIDIEQWDSLSILKETFINESNISGYAYAEYEVDYGNEQKIKYSVYISKSKNNKPLYIINVAE